MLKVLKKGFYTTLQDSGRFGYRNKGVPVSGCMDQIAMEQCNSLLQNNKCDAVLEVTMTGPTLEFNAPTAIAITGADISPLLNDVPINNYQVHKINKGDVLSFGKLNYGFRAYLGVKQGFQVDKVLGSCSQYKPLTPEALIHKGQEIGYLPTEEFKPLIPEMKPDNYFDRQDLKVYKGPEFDLLSDTEVEDLFESTFSVAKENNRMAYQVEEVLISDFETMLTSATLPGTVQLTPSGKLIILMRDGQTTGGYPRVLQLSEEAICILSQKKTGDKLKFELVYS